MKRVLLIAIIFLENNIVNSQTYTWTQKSNFGGGMRYDAFAFAINSKGYAGSGVGGGGNTLLYTFSDFWEYDPATDVWAQKANLPGGCIRGTAAFVIGQKGYVSTGWQPSQTAETYEYDPLLNSWTQKANFGGGARYTTAFFTIGNFAYVGMGYTPYKKDFWKYDPALDTWSQVADVGGQPRQGASGFAINGFGYVFGGGQQGVFYSNELWQYDLVLNTWNQKPSCPCAARNGTAAFTLGNFGFIGTGADDNNLYQDFYRYDPSNDSWMQIANYGGGNRLETFAFSVGGKGYVGTGSSDIFPNLILTQDFWELSINANNISEIDADKFSISPNPVKDVIHVFMSDNKNHSIMICDKIGKTVKIISVSGKQIEIPFKNYSSGIYMLMIENNGNLIQRKFFKE